jgi:hypothetical protein
VTPFRHWSIRRRLVRAFLGMLVPLLALAAAGAVATALVQEALDAVQDETGQLKAAGDFRYALGHG